MKASAIPGGHRTAGVASSPSETGLYGLKACTTRNGWISELPNPGPNGRVLVEDTLRLLRRGDAEHQDTNRPVRGGAAEQELPWSKSRRTYARCCSITARSSGVIEARKSGRFGRIVEI